MYPALAALKALKNRADATLWVGGQGGMEADLVKRQNIPYTDIPAAGLHGVGLRALPGNLLRLVRGVQASRRIVRNFQPDVLLFTGGYVAAPMAVAARKLPMLLYVPDIEPGQALKFLSRFATRIAVTAEDSRRYFPAHAQLAITGYPTRPELVPLERETARRVFGLQPDLPTLMVFGGSKGARSINRAVLAHLNQLLPQTQIIHVSGQLDWEEVQAARAALPGEWVDRYHTFPYLHEEMGAAFSCADLVVSRAGASTLGEFPLFGLPAVLVPYPYAWRYQRVNADYLAQRGAAEVLENDQLAAELVPTVQRLLADPTHLEQMRQAMKAQARPQSAELLADLLCELAAQKGATA